MKGRLLKANDQWMVSYNDAAGLLQTLPLHPYDIKEIDDQANVFDNIEARISAYPDIHFEFELFWETGIEVPFDVAKLKTKCYCGHTNICDCGPQ
jgi:hypothetical protein